VQPCRSLKPLAWYKKLATRKGRLAAGAFLLEGERAIQQIRQWQPEAILEILTTTEHLPRYSQYPCRCVTDNQLRAICRAQTPQGLLAVVRLPLLTYSDQLPQQDDGKILLLEDIQDPGNVGTLIRTAAALCFSGVILTEQCADPFAPKCVQATAGSVLSLWLRRTSRYLELAEALKQRGYTLVAADLHGQEDPSLLCGQKRLLLALGNEASGLSPALRRMAHSLFRIAVEKANAESLNVAACGAICMYLSSRRWHCS
jgi:RNA methyltransferase, TrmH family